MRSEAWPSQSSGTLPFLVSPLINFSKAERIPSAVVPTSVFVPSSIVTVLSGFFDLPCFSIFWVDSADDRDNYYEIRPCADVE